MTFDELLNLRRAIRDYQDRPVPISVIKSLIKEATRAPSSGNDQRPCLLLVLGFPHLKNMYVDCDLAANYLVMGAVDRGLGTCWVNLGAEIRSQGLLQVLAFRKIAKS